MTLLEATNDESNNRRRRPRQGTANPEEQQDEYYRKLQAFMFLLAFDALASLILQSPLIPRLTRLESLYTKHYTLYGSLYDLAFLSIPRILSALFAIAASYYSSSSDDSSTQEDQPRFHKNGDKKTKKELEDEALEEPFGPVIKRFLQRKSIVCESLVLLTGMLLVIKCLARLNVEIGKLDEREPKHPIFWIAISVTALCLILEAVYIDSMEAIAGAYGRGQRRDGEESTNMLTQPLLSADERTSEQQEQGDEERGSVTTSVDDRVKSDIEGDANYKATWTDLIQLCNQDKHLLLAAFVLLVGASLANICVPRFTGNILDALVDASDNHSDDDTGGGTSILNIPGFVSNIKKLVIASVLGGIFGGLRGAIFTLVGARVNVRLRVKLMDSLLSQDISFFEMTRTGDLTSRLSSDTTLVGSQVTTNVNIFLRSSVKAIGVLIFMFLISWQLSLLAFITVPVVSVLSKWYGRFIRRLSQLQQKKLAEGNACSESAISSMATVRAFGAERVEMKEFEEKMENYLSLNLKAAVATLGYSTCLNTLPQLVTALVLFYGGLLVQTTGPDHISGGQLVTFILYLSTLSQSFNSLGGIFASLTRAVGAADKVFELMHREPRLTSPSHIDEEKLEEYRSTNPGPLGISTQKTLEQRVRGLTPDSCEGEITFTNVEMRYPARPQRVVLNDLSLTIAPGSVVALVGASGSGKSSLVSLIQHLYEPTKGSIMIDRVPVHELNPEWLYRNVSVVSQEPALFARSVGRNIMYGLEGTEDEPSQEQIEEVARLANASSFIEKLPLEYDAEIGERGVQLSGGQKQRIALARALVRKPRILLLDEATSALDAESEATVQSAIDGMVNKRSLDCHPARSNMTVVIVAHRLSTIRNADVICVVDNGRIIESGSHDQLILKENGAYKNLVSRQMNAQEKLSNGSESLT